MTPVFGRVLESLVVGELRKHVSCARSALYHFRTAAGSEADVVLYPGDGLVPFGDRLWLVPLSMFWPE